MDPKVKVNGVEYPLVNPDDFDFGEWADAEKIAGQGYDWDVGGYASTLATIYVSVRRVNDAVSVEDIRALKDFEIKMPETNIPPPSGAESSSTDEESKTSSTEGSAPASDDSPAETPELSGVPV